MVGPRGIAAQFFFHCRGLPKLSTPSLGRGLGYVGSPDPGRGGSILSEVNIRWDPASSGSAEGTESAGSVRGVSLFAVSAFVFCLWLDIELEAI
jgi:hypothetical protein